MKFERKEYLLNKNLKRGTKRNWYRRGKEISRFFWGIQMFQLPIFKEFLDSIKMQILCLVSYEIFLKWNEQRGEANGQECGDLKIPNRQKTNPLFALHSRTQIRADL